jgi:3-phytase
LALAAWGCQSGKATEDDSSEASTTTAGSGGSGGGGGADSGPVRLRVGHFNLREMSTAKLLDESDEQATAAAQILARFAPDIISINELQFDMQGVPTPSMPGAPGTTGWGQFDVFGADNAHRLADRIAAAGTPEGYEHRLIFVGNSGYYWEGSTLGFDWFILRGWGEFRGRFNTAILSRYPILLDQVRIISDVPWDALPENHIAKMKAETGIDVPPGFPIFEKGLNIVPVQVNDEVLHLVLLHTVSPAFDPINPYRNYDELRALVMFLDGQLPGVEPLPPDAKFMIVGDLNADPDDGDGLPGAIQQVLDHPSVIAVFGAGAGTKGNNGQYNTYLSGCGLDDGSIVQNPTQKFQLQLDYLLPSTNLGEPLETFLFFPDFQTEREDFDLACRASDHRFAYTDIQL